jgi:hypothetical protein
MKTYKGLRAILGALGAEIDSEGLAIRGSKTYVDPTSGTRTVPSRLAAAATIALALLVTFMLIATSCSVARL